MLGGRGRPQRGSGGEQREQANAKVTRQAAEVVGEHQDSKKEEQPGSNLEAENAVRKKAVVK